MTWLSWRQFRAQALVAGIVLVAAAAGLLVLGDRIRDTLESLTACAVGCGEQAIGRVMEEKFGGVMAATGMAMLLVPALLGAFWGAPLVAREIETGTHRLIWNQSVSRSRWLAVRLATVVLAGALTAGALSALFTWAVSPFDQAIGGRFDPMIFGTRNVAPVAYTIFAVVTGVVVGLLLRRTVPAMAVTLAVFAVLQVLMPALIRPHLQTPVTQTVPFSAESASGLAIGLDGQLTVPGYVVPGAWVLTPGLLVDRSGAPITREVSDQCTGDGPEQAFDCLEEQGLQVSTTYQPAARYWTFQWLESGIFVALAGLFAALAFWRIRQR